MNKNISKRLVCICLIISMILIYSLPVMAAEEDEAVYLELTETENASEDAEEITTAQMPAESVTAPADVETETAVEYYSEETESADESADASESEPADVYTEEEEDAQDPDEVPYIEEPESPDDVPCEEEPEETDGILYTAEEVPADDDKAGTGISVDEEDASAETEEDDEDLRLAAASSYTVNGVKLPLTGYEAGKKWDNSSSYKGGYGCYGFSIIVYEKIWKDNFLDKYGHGYFSTRNTSDNMFRDIAPKSNLMTITAAHAKEYISAAELGAMIRVCDMPESDSDGAGTYMHSMILVDKDRDGSGFTVYHGNWNSKITFTHFTWQEFANTFKNYKYFKYIKWPGAPSYAAIVIPGKVILNTPEMTLTGVKLTWKAASDADSYTIRRKISGDSKWTTLENGFSGTEYEDITAVSGATYVYSVTGYNSNSKREGESGTVSAMCLGAPVNLAASNTNTGIKVSWRGVAGADVYLVYRKASEGSVRKLANVTTSTYTDNTAVPGEEYCYWVLAYSKESKQVSAYVQEGVTGYFIEYPAVTAKGNQYGITLKWKAVTGGDTYSIYRRTGSERYTLIAEDHAVTAFTDETAEYGQMYYYAVLANNNDHEMISGYKAVKAVVLQDPTVGAAAAAGKVTVGWTKVAGAEGYRVYRRAGNGSWKAVKTITSASTRKYVDTSVKKGTDYSYIVVAYTKTTGSVVWGLYNEGTSVKAK